VNDDTGHRTATIARPAPPARRQRKPAPPSRQDARLVRSRRPRVLLALAAAIVAGSLAASVLVLPVRAWLNQREELSNREAELNGLTTANDALAEEVARLETEEGLIETARESLGVVREDEKVYRVVMDPALTGQLPTGWLYPTLGAIISDRTAAAGVKLATEGVGNAAQNGETGGEDPTGSLDPDE
jgi:cell division protein FtsB